MASLIEQTESSKDVSTKMRCAVGIMAYNEAANIASAIKSILQQPTERVELQEIIVVASGCTDSTVPIVTELAKNDPRIRLIVQERREGKASAINLFLAEAKAPVLIMNRADVLMKDGTLELLVAPFHDDKAGMVGAHPIPVNDDRTFLGYTVHLLWDLHDRVARVAPKLGEVVAFRNVVPHIPPDTAVDEISIQALITQLDLQLIYEPRAIVYNRGPATVSDFLRQRRRIYSGHMRTQQQQGYSAATMDVGLVARTLFDSQPFSTPRTALYTLGAVGLEAVARILGAYDFFRRRSHQLWQIASTTKNQITETANSPLWGSAMVFQIANFRQCEIELGGRGAQSLLQQVIVRLRRHLGADGSIAMGHNGAIFVEVPLDRDAAEQLAITIRDDFAASPIHLSGRPDGVVVQMVYGIVAFPLSGVTLASSVAATA